MYLHKSKQRTGRVYLSIAENYRMDGKNKTRTVESLGYLDELEGEWDDPVSHFEEVCAERNARKAAAAQTVEVPMHPMRKIDMRAVNRKNVGCAVPLSVYDALGIEKALRNHTAGSRAGYDINAVMRLLVVERLLDPGSKLSAVANREGYFFKSDFTQDDAYRALDVLAAARDKVISAMNRSIEKGFGRDTRNVFYDVTNYYFECDPDELRRKGVSKESRPNPIVQMGLLQDADAVPITYRLFPGNTNDCQTMLPVLADMKRDLSLSTVTVVADKGLNSSANMAALVASGDGFVFSQSIRGTKSERALRARVLEDAGYEGNAEGTFKKKSWQGHKTVHLKAEDTASGRAEDVVLDAKYVAFWSAKYADRARFEREKTLARARELVENPGAYSRQTHFGAAKYVRGIDFDKDTGEILDAGKARELDLAAIEEDAAADGYYLIVTSRTGWTDDEIIDAYRGLWQIEESFRVAKSDIEARPVYVRTPAHIEAHFLTCYVALAILRLLQKICPGRPSAARITEDLGKVSCSRMADNWWLFDYRSELTQDLFDAVGLEHPTSCMTTAQIRSLAKRRR